MNIRHDIAKELVEAETAKQIAFFEQERVRLKEQNQETRKRYSEAVANGTASQWTMAPRGPEYIDPMIDKWIAHERDVYSKVRVIELPKTGKRFVLAYGDGSDAEVISGTGPFETYKEAAEWFLKSGR